MKTIYKQYKERFIEISGRSRSLFLKNIVKKYSYDLGTILSNFSNSDTFYDFVWNKKKTFTLFDEKQISKFLKQKQTTDELLAAPKITDEQISFQKTAELNSIKYLKREVEELENETGRYELYIGFPFVVGQLNPDLQLRAPLCLFPTTINIEKDNVSLSLIPNQPIMLNKVLILAYSKEFNIKTDNLIQEFYPLQENDAFNNPSDIIEYLNKNGFKLKNTKKKGLIPFESYTEKEKTDGFEVRNYAVLGRFPLANSIYNDYLTLEKDNLTSRAIDLLLSGKAYSKPEPTKTFFFKRRPPIVLPSYTINELDYTQENAVDEINKKDNLVIYGPPGTGKSQTIVNIISDALCKNKKVLVVSQKRAALDVVYSRLGKLNNKVMMIPDPEKDKIAFFDKLKEMHANAIISDSSDNLQRFRNFEININHEVHTLNEISDCLFKKRDFGICLQEMYAQSYIIGKESKDFGIYEKLLQTNIIERNYTDLSFDMKLIEDKHLTKLYFTEREMIIKNPLVRHVLTDIDMHKLKEAHSFLTKVLSKELRPFDSSRYPYSRYLTTFHLERAVQDRKSVRRVADIITSVEYPNARKWLSISQFPLFWGLYPFTKYNFTTKAKDVEIDLHIGLHALNEFEKDYSILKNVLDNEGYALAIGGIINGNAEFLAKLLTALENYVEVRNLNLVLNELNISTKEILDFAYEISDKTLLSFKNQIGKILPIRIYHEIVKNDAEIESILSKTVTFDQLRGRILSLKAEQRELSKVLAMERFSKDYVDFFNSATNSKDYLYQLQKQRGLWPIRRMIEYFQDFLLRLFPCWFLSPQVISSILPLKSEMFDLVVFDEASQIFIESALPTIYRGKSVVVAGDNKQLRPTSGFVKRYLGDDSFDYNMDLSTHAALEVESLLDLATAKFEPVYLSYHYRSQNSELIDFSNSAFYQNKLQIAPNVTRNKNNPPIERIKIKGTWSNRHNHEEAVAIIKLLKSIFKDRQYAETIGIVTFNTEQKEYIEDMLDSEADKNSLFRRQLNNEKSRIIDGENASLFVKNLENVQGDERDIIIFSIGYARNDLDRIVAQFGSLSVEGGENRLNVAITRARKKVYIVTSIEPEELDKIETSKNSGPKLLKKYLQYARAISQNDTVEAKKVLSSLNTKKSNDIHIGSYEEQIKKELEQKGYDVEINLGNTDYKLSLGIFDKELNRYVLGLECDYRAFSGSDSVLERDVFRFKFLESRGWKILRIWSHDWWLNREKVVLNIIENIEKERDRLGLNSENS